tara:strand:- start:229 stop:357 length:129 start_codon:yes stop_codon:yes gene_type:complete
VLLDASQEFSGRYNMNSLQWLNSLRQAMVIMQWASPHQMMLI